MRLAYTPLRLAAEDDEDLVVLSAVLQDALVPMSELAYLPAERRLAFVASRFVWERCEDCARGGEPFERVHCGVTFEGVAGVKSIGVDPAERGRILSLLAVRRTEGGLDLVFAGGATIRLARDAAAGKTLAFLADRGEPWPTRARPAHDLADAPKKTG
jgi:hypothetical protein